MTSGYAAGLVVTLGCVQPAALEYHVNNATGVVPEHVAVSAFARLRSRTHPPTTALTGAGVTVVSTVILTLVRHHNTCHTHTLCVQYSHSYVITTPDTHTHTLTVCNIHTRTSSQHLTHTHTHTHTLTVCNIHTRTSSQHLPHTHTHCV